MSSIKKLSIQLQNILIQKEIEIERADIERDLKTIIKQKREKENSTNDHNLINEYFMYKSDESKLFKSIMEKRKVLFDMKLEVEEKDEQSDLFKTGIKSMDEQSGLFKTGIKSRDEQSDSSKIGIKSMDEQNDSSKSRNEKSGSSKSRDEQNDTPKITHKPRNEKNDQSGKSLSIDQLNYSFKYKNTLYLKFYKAFFDDFSTEKVKAVNKVIGKKWRIKKANEIYFFCGAYMGEKENGKGRGGSHNATSNTTSSRTSNRTANATANTPSNTPFNATANTTFNTKRIRTSNRTANTTRTHTQSSTAPSTTPQPIHDHPSSHPKVIFSLLKKIPLPTKLVHYKNTDDLIILYFESRKWPREETGRAYVVSALLCTMYREMSRRREKGIVCLGGGREAVVVRFWGRKYKIVIGFDDVEDRGDCSRISSSSVGDHSKHGKVGDRSDHGNCNHINPKHAHSSYTIQSIVKSPASSVPARNVAIESYAVLSPSQRIAKDYVKLFLDSHGFFWFYIKDEKVNGIVGEGGDNPGQAFVRFLRMVSLYESNGGTRNGELTDGTACNGKHDKTACNDKSCDEHSTTTCNGKSCNYSSLCDPAILRRLALLAKKALGLGVFMDGERVLRPCMNDFDFVLLSSFADTDEKTKIVKIEIYGEGSCDNDRRHCASNFNGPADGLAAFHDYAYLFYSEYNQMLMVKMKNMKYLGLVLNVLIVKNDFTYLYRNWR